MTGAIVRREAESDICDSVAKDTIDDEISIRYRHIHAIVSIACQLLPFAPGACAAVENASPRSLMTVLYLAVCCSAFAHLAWSYLLPQLSTSHATSILMLNSPMAALIGAIWFGEIIPALCGSAGCYTLVGVALVQLRRG